MGWEKTGMGWDIVPWGINRMITYIQQNYPTRGGIFITENGCGMEEDELGEAMEDTTRVEYLQKYLLQINKAIQNGADVKGYFVWSLLDNFEWQFGYSKRFGIVRVDYKTQVRIIKQSAEFMSELAQANSMRPPVSLEEASGFQAL